MYRERKWSYLVSTENGYHKQRKEDERSVCGTTDDWTLTICSDGLLRLDRVAYYEEVEFLG